MKPRTRITIALTAGLAALAAPAAAGAAVTPTIAGPQLTLTGDATADNITLTANAAGLLTHSFGTANGLADATDFNTDPNVTTTLPSNGTINVVADAGGGNDNVNLSAPNLAPSTINGADGDDIIVGSGAIDAISGGAGNDRITGFRGNETINGDDGNDVMIWNNGDGNDVNEGGAGVDETLITAGNADDVMAVTANGARTLFNRTNAAFSVDMGAVEKLVITSFSGNDSLTTGAGVTLPMNIDAGTGDDNISTGDGADVIAGGDGNDSLSGAGGGDRIIGDRGSDTFNGGAGDDTLNWNNGDGSDVMNGDGDVDRIEVNLAPADDVTTLKPENGRVRFDRLNLVPFNLSIASSEVFEHNGLGGNDSLATTAGIGIAVVADGGAGNDTLTGADEPDTFFGGSGDDVLDTGAGNDVADGGDGNDRLTIRDGAGDLARGGAGADWASADAITVDAVAPDVETVERPAVVTPPAPAAGAPTVAKTARVRKGTASLRVSCPAGTTGCTGTVTLLSAKAIKAGRFNAQLVLGRKTVTLKAGETKTVKLKLASGTARLAKRNKLTVTARVFSKVAGERSSKVALSFR
jgi:Ca2+-binding RTX toxin-like protein